MWVSTVKTEVSLTYLMDSMWKPVSPSLMIGILVFMGTLGFRYVISMNLWSAVREPRNKLAEYMS